ncbi:Macrolide export ATP-binding/permease protein MacB [Lacunisphaera limnophila]|uniref:Macrolide export ATP-binding/permease protein MacB n=1 Tax=Lacunisphaera limnophila TaxID=1838286 RepID=A0A1D8AXD8_9BACT|nr:ADOP family duplicated permease [Lacunisphaera limnophila]AOS45537.1 Macrolide export ATP-binding/permease protein MacB [Lacunisphaera limnophila]
MSSLLQDLKFSLRLLAKSPGFSAATVAVLALGIGLNTGMFTFIYNLAFSPRPLADPDRIVQVYTQNRKNPEDFRLFSLPLWRELSGRRDLFTDVMAFNHTLVGQQEGTETRRAFASIISANYFATLGVPLARGRPFTAEEERPGAALPVVIVSHAHWAKSGFAPDILGRTLRINERTYTIVGVTPVGFTGTTMLFGPEFYFPLGVFETLENFTQDEARRALDRADTYKLFLVARLAPGVERSAATAALDALGTHLEQAFPVEFKDQTVTIAPLARLGTSSAPRSEAGVLVFCSVLMGLAGSVLLIVCLNLAGLLLARGQSRRKEFAIRLALGGRRRQLVRQLCLEGLVLALLGGGLGILIAQASLDLIAASLTTRLPIGLFGLSTGSGAVLAATAVICLGATLAFSLGPALRLSRGDVLSDLKLQSGENAPAPHVAWWRPRHLLVVTQIALSLCLLIIAGVFMRTAALTTNAEHGYRADNTVVAELDSGLGGLDEARSLELFRSAQERLASLPGVQAAAIATIVPYGFVNIGRSVRRDGPALPDDAKPVTAAEGRAYDSRWNSVGADYFTAMGLALKQGRPFSPAECAQPGAPRVAVIDEILARQLWPEGDALGQFVRFNGEAHVAIGPMQVVGIVTASQTNFFEDEPSGSIYVPFAHGFASNVHFHVRPAADTEAAAEALVAPVRAVLHEAAPGVPVFKVRSFRQHKETSMEVWAVSLGSVLLVTFSGFAMLVAVVGIYSVKSYQVSRRTREIGIRMALGARPGHVQALILREGLATASLGIAAGLVLGLGLNRVFASVLVGAKPFDPVVLLGAATAFFLAATVASWLPARRATHVNPLEALRAE